MKRPVALLLVFAALAGLASCAHKPEPARVPLHELGRTQVGDVPYQPLKLQGRVVLLNFFATWCFPCLAELPFLKVLQKDYEARGFQVVGVGMDLEGPKILDPFVREQGLSYPVVAAERAVIEGQSSFGRIAVLPTSILMDDEGRMITAFVGLVNPEELRALIDRSLKDEGR